MLTLPVTFVKSGLIPTVFTLLFVCFLSSFCCLNMAKTISKVPGNANFKQEVEYSEAFRYFWGERWNYITQVLFFVCVLCLEVSAIVDTAHVVDTFLGHWFPLGSFAYRIHPPSLLFSSPDPNTNTTDSGWEQWKFSECTNAQYNQGLCLPFLNAVNEDETPAEQGLLFTLGMLITTLIFLPMALMDLKDNAAWQVVGFVVLLITSVQFMVSFAMSDDLDVKRVSLWGDDWDDLLGVVLFNFALVIAIPAWLYEREPHVDVPTVVHGSNMISIVLYCGIGILGAMAMPNVSENMLESILSGALGPWMQIGASIFEFYIVGLSVPLYSVLNRLNIMANGVSQTTGNLLAVFLPFALSWFLYDGGAVAKLLAWGGVIFTSMIAFILPIALALYVATEFDYDGSVVVYFGYIRTVAAEITTLRVMMVLSFLSVILAVVGNFLP
jgi:Transmembrane amino acid transporter protein